MKRIEDMTPTEEADVYEGALRVLEAGHCSASLVSSDGKHCLMGAVGSALGYSDEEMGGPASGMGMTIQEIGVPPILNALALQRHGEMIAAYKKEMPAVLGSLPPAVLHNDARPHTETRDLLREAIRIKRAEAAAEAEQPKQTVTEAPSWVKTDA